MFSNPKLFADNISTFSVLKDHLNSNKLNEELSKISQWKMSFNLDVSKQAKEVIFSCKTNISNYPVAFCKNFPINRKSTQKKPWSMAGLKKFFFVTYQWET